MGILFDPPSQRADQFQTSITLDEEEPEDEIQDPSRCSPLDIILPPPPVQVAPYLSTKRCEGWANSKYLRSAQEIRGVLFPPT